MRNKTELVGKQYHIGVKEICPFSGEIAISSFLATPNSTESEKDYLDMCISVFDVLCSLFFIAVSNLNKY